MKIVPLTQGQVTLVDDADYDLFPKGVNMKYKAVVIGIKAKSDADDSKRRVEIKPEGSYGSFIVPSDDLKEDEELCLLVMTKEQAAGIVERIDALEAISASTRPMNFQLLFDLADALRPDPPPPWEQPDEAKTQEFRLGGTA